MAEFSQYIGDFTTSSQQIVSLNQGWNRTDVSLSFNPVQNAKYKISASGRRTDEKNGWSIKVCDHSGEIFYADIADNVYICAGSVVWNCNTNNPVTVRLEIYHSQTTPAQGTLNYYRHI